MPKTLLLADDSVTIQKVVGITFANEDVELVTVDNGDDALPRARQVKPDLILADIGMPGLNGYELCAAIRRDPNLAHIPVLLLTGTFETYDEQKAREVGASGHIAKPFEAQALVDRVFQLLAQAPQKPVTPKAAPQPQAAAPQSQPQRPAAPPPRPQVTAPPTPVPTPRPAAPPSQSAQPRPRPELPPVPHAPTPPPTPRPAPTPAPAPMAAPPTPKPAPKRESQPFEFELPPAPAAPAPLASGAAALADQEPVWEAEPEAEVLAEEPAAESHASDAGATRLFAPDLLGRPGTLPEVPEPPRPPAGRKADFSFDDLDFEEPTHPPANQSGIFGESSGPSAEPEPEFAQPIPEPPLEVEALADPLYSQTTFLDPSRAGGGATPVAPPLPDLLEPTPEPHDPSDSGDDLDLAEADTALEDEPTDGPDVLARPFSPDTDAALGQPRFERMPPPAPEPRTPEPRRAPAAEAATRLMMDDDAPTPSPVRVTPPPSDGRMGTTPPMRQPPTPQPPAPQPRVTPAAAEADTLPPKTPRAPAPSLAASRASALVDSTLLAQSVEKVAWEAFGALSEQVVTEVMKRVESVMWEVVPQLCERLIREEIARLKAEMSD